MTKVQIQASLSLLVAILCWATIPLFLHSFRHEIDAWTANGVRYPFSMILWLGPLLYFYSRNRVPKNIWRLALVPSFVNLFGQTFFAMTPYYLEPALMMFLGRISILFAVGMSLILFIDERALVRSKIFWAGAIVCLGGFIGMNVLSESLYSSVTMTGLIILLCFAFFMAMYGVSVRYWMQGIDPWISFPVICIYTSIGLFIMMWMFGEPARLLDLSSGRLTVLAISAVIGIALGHTFYYYSLEHIGVSICAGVSLVTPFLTAIGSYFIFQEVLSFGQWVSGTLIFFGAMCLLSAQRHLGKRHSPAPITSTAPEIEEIASAEIEKH